MNGVSIVHRKLSIPFSSALLTLGNKGAGRTARAKFSREEFARKVKLPAEATVFHGITDVPLPVWRKISSTGDLS